MAPATMIIPMATAAIAVALSEIAMMYLVALLVAQALGAALGERSKLQPLGRYLSVGTIPLLFPFLLIMIIEGLEAL